MQDKAPKSSLIRLNNLANKKARRRLVGSIFLLVIALLVLFQVTSKIKPVQIKPESIEIKAGNRPNPDKLKNPIVVESVPIPLGTIESSESSMQFKPVYLNKSKSPKVEASKASASKTITDHEKQLTPETIKTSQEKQQSSALDKISLDKEVKPAASKSTVSESHKLHLSPIISTEQVSKTTPNPADILDGIASEKNQAKFFVQLMASMDKNKLLIVKNMLSKEGVYTKLQSSKKGNNTIYRLRIGPFKDKAAAKAKLAEVQEKLTN